MNEVTVVTAFFDIGRGGFSTLPRSSDTYLEQFAFWARMRNQLVVYTDEANRAKVLEVRGKFGLTASTTVIVIDDIYSIEPAIYARMMKIERCGWFRDFRLMPEANSGLAKYSYLMLLKSWFVKDAVSRGLTGPTVAWVDFGFNHGGKVFPRSEDFGFTWTSSLLDRVVLFCLGDEEEKPIFEMVRRLSDFVMGAMIVLPSYLAEMLWEINRESMVALNRVGLMDDDQLIQLMSYREHPDLFELRRSDWFLPMKDVASSELRVREVPDWPWHLRQGRRVVREARRQRLAMLNSWRLYRSLARARA